MPRALHSARSSNDPNRSCRRRDLSGAEGVCVALRDLDYSYRRLGDRTSSDSATLTERGLPMADCLLLVDVINDFLHEDGDALLETFRLRHQNLVAAIDRARASGIPVVYANDMRGRWNGDSAGFVVETAAQGKAGQLILDIAPREHDPFIFKPRYSAFDSTPLAILLNQLDIARLLIAGSATEACVTQTAIAARELGFKVTVLADACATTDLKIEQVALEYLETVAGVVVEHS